MKNTDMKARMEILGLLVASEKAIAALYAECVKTHDVPPGRENVDTHSGYTIVFALCNPRI